MMDQKRESLDKSLDIIKDSTQNDALVKMIKTLEDTSDTDQTLSSNKLKILSHYAYKDVLYKKNNHKK